jgi:hypothetical protein
MFAIAPFCVLPFAVAEVTGPAPPIVVLSDTHDGGRNTHRKLPEPKYDEYEKLRQARRKEVIAVYEELVEGRPRVVAKIVEPFVDEKSTSIPIPPVNAIDFDALLADVTRMQALYRELEEKDDEEALLLLL